MLMTPTPRNRSSLRGLLLAAILAAIPAWTAPYPAIAQESEPAQDAAPEEAPARPKPRPRSRPAAPAATPAAAPAAKKAGSDATVLEPAAASGNALWPNGAKSVSEAYGDWSMNCNKEAERVDCVVIQSQGDRRTGRRQFSVELRTPKDGRAEGLILMPFGMQIEPGVTFKLDDRALGKGAPYSYCVSDGCLVPISLPTLATDTMKTAQNLVVFGTKPDAKEPTPITVPLSGFAAAFARADALGN